MKTFEEMWVYSNNVYGAFEPTEAKIMYDIVVKLPERSVIVEIGSYFGRSSSLLGQIACEKDMEFTCIDNFVTTHEYKIVKPFFFENMDQIFIRYQLLPWFSRRGVHLFNNEEIDFLFIDGDHRYIGVKEDCDLWIPKLKKGSFMCFHDYNSSWDGVKKAVDERLELEDRGVMQSMAVRIKK